MLMTPAAPVLPTLAGLLGTRPLLVVDLECTCMLFRPDEDQVQEVIEFGHTVLAARVPGVADAAVPAGQSTYVRPTATPVTRGCTKLTGITPQMVAKAPRFTERMAELSDWVRGAGLAGWASWGDFDVRMLARQCEREGVANPLAGLPHFNAKQLLSPWLATLEGTTVRERQGGYGLRTALVAMGLVFEGREHSGAADAHNTARVIDQARQRGAVEPPRRAAKPKALDIELPSLALWLALGLGGGLGLGSAAAEAQPAKAAPSAAAGVMDSRLATPLRYRLTDVEARRALPLVFPLLKLDNALASERANLQLHHLVLGTLPPGPRELAAGKEIALPANDISAGTTELDITELARRNGGRVLTLELRTEGCGAYCESYTQHFAFDARNGRLLVARELLTPAGMQAVGRLVAQANSATLKKALADATRQARKPGASKDERDTAEAQQALYSGCLPGRYGPDGYLDGARGLSQVQWVERGLVVHQDRCSNHAMRALDDVGDLSHRVDAEALRPHLSAYGRTLLLGEGDAAPPERLSPHAQVFRGLLDGRLPVTLFFRWRPDAVERDGEPGLDATYYYDRYRKPIRLSVAPQPGQPGAYVFTEPAAEPGVFTVRLDAPRGRLTGEWRQGAAKPLAFEAEALAAP